MNRRELLKMISAATGVAFIGSPLLLSGCSSTGDYRSAVFSNEDVSLLAEIAETIIPRTSTPGAKDADVAPFMTKIVDNCYSEADQQTFHAGLVNLQQRCVSEFSADFASLSPEVRTQLLTTLDNEARQYQLPEGGTSHYFTMFKQLTLFSFFTSEIAQKQVLRLVPIPGRFDGCFPYNEGDPSWAI